MSSTDNARVQGADIPDDEDDDLFPEVEGEAGSTCVGCENLLTIDEAWYGRLCDTCAANLEMD